MSAEWPQAQPAWRVLWRHSVLRLAAVAGLLGQRFKYLDEIEKGFSPFYLHRHFA